MFFVLVLIGFVIYCFYRAKEEKEKTISEIKEKEKMKAEEKEREEKQKIAEQAAIQKSIDLQHKWRATELFSTLLSTLKSTAIQHEISVKDIFISNDKDDLLIVVIMNTNIKLFSYIGKHCNGYGYDVITDELAPYFRELNNEQGFDFYGNIKFWHYDKKALTLIHDYNLGEMGYNILDYEEMRALSYALQKDLRNWTSDKTFCFEDKHGYTVINFKNSYAKPKSVFD